MRKTVFLTTVILMTVGAASAMKALSLAPSAPKGAPTVTISIEEIHRQVDVQSLPLLEVRELS
jgi:hypothetical protein